MILDVVFVEEKLEIDVDFGEIVRVNTADIPKEYGLVTYDHNKVITVS